MEELTKAVGNWVSTKNMKYNALNLLYLCQGDLEAKRTVEFRQHEGTMDPERIVQWTKTVVGIVNFVHAEGQTSLVELLRRGVEEGNWSVVELLRYMRLDEQAEFYSRRLYQVPAEPDMTEVIRTWGYKWQYEEDRANGLLDDQEYETQQKLRLLWETYQVASLSYAGSTSDWFAPEDEQWPKHTRQEPPSQGTKVQTVYSKVSEDWEDINESDEDQEISGQW
ncbi:hypothetical protein N431DRAFT_338312 [Stipitochalara longipes BDJ]|nr:hypothetical protein N431DRAFT_338312 [Stipitochalara longipes BDJ]